MGVWAELVVVFAGALLAFTLGEWAVRVRHRHSMIEEAVYDLAMELPVVVVSYARWNQEMDH